MFTSKKMYYNAYLPVEGDIILGIVVDKSSSHLLIDCKAKKLAKLLIMNSERDRSRPRIPRRTPNGWLNTPRVREDSQVVRLGL